MQRPRSALRLASIVLVMLAAGDSLSAQSAAPVVGMARRYCNPLPIEASSQDGSPRGVNLGDVTIVREGGAYYMFNTGGGAWISTDLVDWKYRPVTGAAAPV